MNDDREETVQNIVKHEFNGIIAEHRTDPIFRRVLAIGALSCWHMYGFKGNQKVKEHALGQEDAQSIYWAFRNTGFLEALDALVYSEHSWGWTFHDLDLLEGLIGLVQTKLDYLPEVSRDPISWGARNIFKAFVAEVDSVNIRMTTIPCVCFHCIQGNPWLFIKNIKEIRTVRQESMRYLTENVHVDELEDKYEMK